MNIIQSVSSTTTIHSLFLNNLSLWVHLGCSAEERKVPQEVRMSLEFRFLSCPKGSISDELDGTICYAKISQAIFEYSKERQFNLIEKLGFDLFKIIKSEVNGVAKIKLQAHKVSPPVKDLSGGATYCVSEFQ